MTFLSCTISELLQLNFHNVRDCLWPSEILQIRYNSWKSQVLYAFGFTCQQTVVNTCYISEIWELDRFQTAKVTIKVISRSLVLLSFDRPYIISCWSSIVTVCLIFSEILSLTCHKLKRSIWSWTHAVWGNLSSTFYRLIFTMVNVHTNYDKGYEYSAPFL